jgi:pilus assembly protein Flp/PilA
MYLENVTTPNKSLERNSNMRAHIKRFLANESGATAIEYGLIAALVSVAAIAAITGVGNNLKKTFNKVSGNMT